MLSGLAALAYTSNDMVVFRLCLLGVCAFIGFLSLNFPFGKLFLGDGGAYLAGFWVAECAVMLLYRNPEISTWAVLLCCIYPVWETLFSMWRKSVVRKTGMGQPDKLHFHMLIYRRWTRRHLDSDAPVWLRHMLTTMAITILVATVQVISWFATFNDLNHIAFIAGIGAFGFIYTLIYKNLTIKSTALANDEATPLPHAN